MKKPKFTWKVIRIPISKIKPTPNNFKLKTDEGQSMFNTSVDKFGRAGAVIVNAKNPDGSYYLINGNTNIDKAKELKETYVDASVPNRKLTPKEFEEFAAMFDAIRAGEVDIFRIKEELGTTSDFYKRWGWTSPEKVLKNLAELEKVEIKGRPNGKKEIKSEAITRPLTLLFRAEENEEFIQIGESLYARFKVDNITDLALKIMRYVKKH